MKKVAILGASYLQLPLILKAKALGHQVHCFAWDTPESICKAYADYFYPISVLSKDEILEVSKLVGIDGILTIATDICIPVISFIAQELDLIGNSVESSIKTTNKEAMRLAFSKANINSPRNITVDQFDPSDFDDFRFPLIIKPIDRSGSLGVSKVFNLEELKQKFIDTVSLSLSKKCIIEEFIEGVEVSVEGISWHGQHKIITVTDKVLTNEPFFVELSHHQPSLLSKNILSDIELTTIQILNATGIQYGASHTELRITPSGEIYAIEVGGRMGGDFIGSDLVELSTGYDYLKAVIDIALGEFIMPDDIQSCSSSGVYFLSKDTEHLLPYFETDNTFDIRKEIIKDELKFVKNSNERSGYLIYQSKQKVII